MNLLQLIVSLQMLLLTCNANLDVGSPTGLGQKLNNFYRATRANQLVLRLLNRQCQETDNEYSLDHIQIDSRKEYNIVQEGSTYVHDTIEVPEEEWTSACYDILSMVGKYNTSIHIFTSTYNNPHHEYTFYTITEWMGPLDATIMVALSVVCEHSSNVRGYYNVNVIEMPDVYVVVDDQYWPVRRVHLNRSTNQYITFSEAFSKPLLNYNMEEINMREYYEYKYGLNTLFLLHGANLMLRVNYEVVRMTSAQDYYYHSIATPAVVVLVDSNNKTIHIVDPNNPMDLLFENRINQEIFMPNHVLVDILLLVLVILFTIVIAVPIGNIICIARSGYRRPKPIEQTTY